MPYIDPYQLIRNDWIYRLTSKISQEFLLKVFYYNNGGIKKVKNLQKLSNEEIYFTLQNNYENYNKPFKFITRANTLKDHSVLTPATWGKIFTDWFKKCTDGYIFFPFGTNSSTFPYL